MMWVLIKSRDSTFHSSSTGRRHTQRYVLQNLDQTFVIFLRHYQTTWNGFLCKIPATAVSLSCSSSIVRRPVRNTKDTGNISQSFKAFLIALCSIPSAWPTLLPYRAQVRSVWSDNSDNSRTKIHGLTKGHRMNEKTANTIFSMLHNLIRTRATAISNGYSLSLILHVDNCTRQNKDRYTLMYLL